MKAKLQKAIKVLLGKLGKHQAALNAAKRVYATADSQVHRLHAKETKAAKEADKLRKQGHPKKAVRKDARATNLRAKRQAAQARREKAIGEVKRLTNLVDKDKGALEKRRRELKRLGVRVKGNKAVGGTPQHRLAALALAAAAACASGKRRNFYSQSGTWDVDHPVTGESYGERSDCSSFVTSLYKGAGLPDPNGTRYTGGYTGTLAAHGRPVSEANIQPGDLVLYGTAPFHHVEMYVGPGSRTIGHGSPPVDAGVIHLLPGPVQIRRYV